MCQCANVPTCASLKNSPALVCEAAFCLNVATSFLAYQNTAAIFLIFANYFKTFV